MNTDDQHASPQAQALWGKLTLRERRQRRAERKREAIYERAKVSVAPESAESVMAAIPPGQPGVERRLNAGDHVVFDPLNRNLVAGKTTRVSPVLDRVAWGLAIVLFGAAVTWIAGGPAGLVIILVGAGLAAAAAVFESRKSARFEEHGRLLTGEVTQVEEGYVSVTIYPPPARAPAYHLKIFYRFLTPTGEERAGDVRFGTEGYPVPSAGDQLAILYADEIKERVL